MHVLAPLLLAVTISTIPPTPLIETTKSGQAVNFDLLITNDSAAAVTIDAIEATVLNEEGAMVLQRRLAANGASIETVPNREIAPGAKLVVFNPFPEFESDIPLHAIRYDVTTGETTSTIVVKPQPYVQKTDLILPLQGRVFVHDGHDFYSHHRRLDITGGMTTALGVTSNMTRYAYDFTIVDGEGRMHRGDGEKSEDWPGFGQPVRAPGAGVVVKSAGDRFDGAKRTPLTMEGVLADITLIFGNFVVIDHGSGEFSVLAHMREGSVTVKPGDRVRQGQKIGEIGWSGDAMFPHLHYQLQRDASLGEGLPSYFRDYRRFTGTSFKRVARGQIDTGDVVEATR